MSTLKIWESVQSVDGDPLIRLDSKITTNSVTFTGTAGQSAAFDDDTGIITVLADADCAVAIGANPTATTADFPVPAGVRYDFRVSPGQKISAIANPGASGTSPLPSGAATAANQTTQITAEQAILAKLIASPATEATLASLLGGQGANTTFWNAAGAISNSTVGVTIKAAAGAGVRNYITGIQLKSQALSGVSEFSVKDGAGGTPLFTTFFDTTASAPPINIRTPLPGSANTLVQVAMNVAVTGLVYYSIQGYTA